MNVAESFNRLHLDILASRYVSKKIVTVSIHYSDSLMKRPPSSGAVRLSFHT
jgi:hypothetical protein